MVRLSFNIELAYDIGPGPGDFVFNIHAAETARQFIVNEQVSLSQPVSARMFYEAPHGNRYMRVRAQKGPFAVRYAATVDIDHHRQRPETISETPVARLPANVLRYLYPSRYCESDKLLQFAGQQFGGIRQGYSRAQAICEWVTKHVAFTSGASDFTTSATDTFRQKAGVCRDFAHLMIALCRAVNIPARFASGIDYGADPALGPTDFHAYVEVFLNGRWYLFDPSGTAIPMGFVRFGTGRDAADVSFATIFGNVKSSIPVVHIVALDDPAKGFELPRHGSDALSTAQDETYSP